MTCLDLPGFPTPSLQLRESTGLYFNCISLCHSLEALKAASRLVCHPPLKATVLYYLMSRILKTIVPCCVFSVCLEWRVSLAPFISSWSGVLRQELLVRGHLSVHYVFHQGMFAMGIWDHCQKAANTWSQELQSMLWPKKYSTIILARAGSVPGQH